MEIDKLEALDFEVIIQKLSAIEAVVGQFTHFVDNFFALFVTLWEKRRHQIGLCAFIQDICTDVMNPNQHWRQKSYYDEYVIGHVAI